MYERIVWKDEVRNPDKTFSYTDNGDGTMTFARAGTQVQEGTNQNAVHLNQMDADIEAANLAVDLLMTYISSIALMERNMFLLAEIHILKHKHTPKLRSIIKLPIVVL